MATTWGDYLAHDALWRRTLPVTTRRREALAAPGGVAGPVDLPAQGVHGGTRTPMVDRNSDQVAHLVQDWMARQGLTRQDPAQ